MTEDGVGERMTRYLVATASERTTEAACEYLSGKIGPDDEVFVVTVEAPGEPDDGDAALAVAQVELAELVHVRTFRRTGTPAREIVAFARDNEVDEIIMGPTRSGTVGTIGSTTRSVLARVDVPVFVVPGVSS